MSGDKDEGAGVAIIVMGLVLVLLMGAGGFLYFRARAEQERAVAMEHRLHAEHAMQRAREAETMARQLAQSPAGTEGVDVLALLAQVSEGIAKSPIASSPGSEARLREKLAEIYTELGQPDRAQAERERAHEVRQK